MNSVVQKTIEKLRQWAKRGDFVEVHPDFLGEVADMLEATERERNRLGVALYDALSGRLSAKDPLLNDIEFDDAMGIARVASSQEQDNE